MGSGFQGATAFSHVEKDIRGLDGSWIDRWLPVLYLGVDRRKCRPLTLAGIFVILILCVYIWDG